MLAHLRDHVLREARVRVHHRHEDAVELEIGIRPVRLEAGDQVLHHAKPLERVVLGLHRHENAVGRRERGRHEDAQRRRAVEKDVVEDIRVADRLQHVPHHLQAVGTMREVNLAAGEVDFGRDDVEVLVRRRLDHVGDLALTDQAGIERHALLRLQAKARRRVRLRVEVDHQHRAALPRERRREVHHRRRLAHAALLVGDRNHARIDLRFHIKSYTRLTSWKNLS